MIRRTPAGTKQEEEELPRKERTTKSMPRLTIKGGDATQTVHLLQRWMMLMMVSLNTWGDKAARIWESAVETAKAQHAE